MLHIVIEDATVGVYGKQEKLIGKYSGNLEDFYVMNLVFQVNIKPNDIKTSGRKKFTYSKELYNFSNLRSKELQIKIIQIIFV